MASSGSANFSVTGKKILEGALRSIGVLGRGRALSGDDVSTGLEALNMLVKQWQGKADFAPGLKVWARKRVTLFLQDGEYEYDLGPSGDHATASYTETAMRVAASANATTMEVDSTTGMTAGDYIGIVLDSGSIHWTTIDSVTDADTVELTTGVTGAAAIDNKVYFYTTKIQRPLEILTLNLRDSNGIDIPLERMRTLEEYEGIADKDVAALPTRYFYETALTNGVLRFDTAPDDVSYLAKLVVLRPIDDFDTQTDDADYPQHWYRALKFALALDLAPEYGKEPGANLLRRAAEALAIAQNVDPEVSDEFFEPER